MQVQGNLSASSALLIQEGIAKPDPPTEAHREAPLVPWGISALEELVTSNVALSLLEDTALKRLCQRKARFVRRDSGVGEAQMTRQRAQEAPTLLLKAQHRSQRASTVLWGHSRARGLRAAQSARLEQWLLHWAWRPATNARRASLLPPRALVIAEVVLQERQACQEAPRRRTATWTVQAL